MCGPQCVTYVLCWLLYFQAAAADTVKYSIRGNAVLNPKSLVFRSVCTFPVPHISHLMLSPAPLGSISSLWRTPSEEKGQWTKKKRFKLNLQHKCKVTSTVCLVQYYVLLYGLTCIRVMCPGFSRPDLKVY